MYHFEKKNSKILSPEGPRENVWGPRENVSPDPAVALDGFAPTHVFFYIYMEDVKISTKFSGNV